MAKVLLVDDDPLVRSHIEIQLESLGHGVLAAENADEALERFSSESGIDLVISDVRMPGSLDGFELASALRQMRADLPLLLISGNTGSVNGTDKAMESSAHFLAKPFGRRELSEKIQLCIEGGGAGARRPEG